MSPASNPTNSSRVHRWLTGVLRAVIVVGVGLSVYEQQWLNALVITAILLLTLVPTLLGRGLDVYIPPEFELLTIAFIFAALFLGETRDYYSRFWWWDIALHTTSGGLLGVLGVLLVYVLNQNARIDLHMQPEFVAFFAFCFAVAVGTVWEIFEFAMDQIFGMNMQKSGLNDTMGDLIVNTIGALIISTAGYFYVKGEDSLLFDRLVRRLLERNFRFRRAAR